jgi:pyruvyl transferase EpsO
MNQSAINWNILLNNLKLEHKKIFEILPTNSKVAFLDIPMYDNVGDLLIYLGTLAFLKENNVNIHYKAGKGKRFIRFSKINECDVILLQGGGNFGDLYPDFQKYRETIVEKFKDKIIIQLPQSIHFSSDYEMRQSAEKFFKHDNFYMFVRDKESLDVASNFSNKTHLMPDMAHSLHPIKECFELPECINDSNCRILNMARVDDEIDVSNRYNSFKKKSFDWLDLLTYQDFRMLEHVRKFSKIAIFENAKISAYDKIAQDLFFKSVNYFENFDLISTDRLHGCILSVLLGKHIHMRDNSYSKIERYKNVWLSDYPYFTELPKLG